MPGYNVSVEEALKRSGIIDEFINKSIPLSSHQLNELTGYHSVLKSNIANLQELNAQYQPLLQEAKTAQGLLRTLSKQLNNADLTVDDYSSIQTNIATQEANINQFQTNQQARMLEERMGPLFMETFKLEHEILDRMSQIYATTHNPNTTNYAIYFYGDGIEGNITRGVIDSKDLYESKYVAPSFSLNLQGITLSKDIIKEQYGLMKNVTPFVNYDTGEINVAMEADFQKLSLEATSFFKDMKSEFSDLIAYAKHHHLAQDERKYLVLEHINREQAAIQEVINRWNTQLYNSLVKLGTYDGRELQKQGINRGHLVEAYERLVQSNGSISYIRALKESFGNDPWYISGDVNQTQVKSFFDGKDRQIASYASILQLGTALVNITGDFINNTRHALTEIQNTGAKEVAAREGQLRQQEFEAGIAEYVVQQFNLDFQRAIP